MMVLEAFKVVPFEIEFVDEPKQEHQRKEIILKQHIEVERTINVF